MFAERELGDPALNIPPGKAPPKITLDTGRGLITFLGRLGEQLHDDCRDRARDARQSFAWRHWLSCDMAMHPFHRIGSAEGKATGQHFVKHDAQSVEITPRIDRTIHSSGLLGRHVGERAGNDLGRLGRLPFPAKSRRDTEAGQPDVAGR